MGIVLFHMALAQVQTHLSRCGEFEAVGFARMERGQPTLVVYEGSRSAITLKVGRGQIKPAFFLSRLPLRVRGRVTHRKGPYLGRAQVRSVELEITDQSFKLKKGVRCSGS